MAKRRFRSRGRFRRVRRRTTRVRRTKKFIKRVVRSMQEIKWASTRQGGNFDASDKTQINIEVTPQFVPGSNKNSVVGQSLRYKFLQFRLTMLLYDQDTGAASPSTQFVRVLLYVRRGENDTGPITITELLRGTSTEPQGFIDQNQIRVLYDKGMYMGVSPNAANVQLPATRQVLVKRRIFNRVPLAYDTGTTPFTFFPRNINDRFYLAMWTDSNTAGQNSIGYTWSSTVSYYDL